MRVRPLRVLRGFLYRLGEGHRQARDGPRRLAACRPPGPRVVYNLDDSNGVGNGSGYFGDLPWKPHAFRKRGEGMTCAVQSKICSTWGWSTNNTGFWDGPSGPHLWERSDGRFIAADHDAWGDPALIDLVWQGKAACIRLPGDSPINTGRKWA